MNLQEDFKRYSEGYGFIAPFCLVMIGMFFLFRTPSLNELKIYSGKIVYNQYLQVLRIEEINTKFIIPEAQKEAVFKKLKSAKHARVWVKSNCSERCTIKQLKLDNKFIIEYKYKQEIIVPIIFVFLGLLLIPIVINAKRKQKKREK